MKNHKSIPAEFLDVQELSALENETVRGGNTDIDADVKAKKEKKKER